MRVGDTRIELLGSLGPDTPVGKFLGKRGPGLHHLAFEVDDLAAELERLAAAGAELIDAGAAAWHVRHDCCVRPSRTRPDGVLAELVTNG